VKSLADDLPPEVAARVHPDWRANEAAYWAARPGLLATHGGRWVAFANGAVIASSTSPVEVFQAAHASGLHPFVIRVGAEREACRMRRATFQAERAVTRESLSAGLSVLVREAGPRQGCQGANGSERKFASNTRD
jgi:hypothetical protein